MRAVGAVMIVEETFEISVKSSLGALCRIDRRIDVRSDPPRVICLQIESIGSWSDSFEEDEA